MPTIARSHIEEIKTALWFIVALLCFLNGFVIIGSLVASLALWNALYVIWITRREIKLWKKKRRN